MTSQQVRRSRGMVGPLRFAALGGLVVVAAVAGGCGSSSSPARPAAPPTSVSSASPSPSTPAPTPEASQTGPAPATGPTVSLAHITVNLTPEWTGEKDQSETGDQIAVNSRGSLYSLSLSQNDLGAITLDEAARSYNRSSLYPTKQEVLDPVTVNGRQWFHLAGQVNDLIWAEDYGTLVGDLQVTVSLETQRSIPSQMRTAVLDAILASAVVTP